jgi:hypothetical protein
MTKYAFCYLIDLVQVTSSMQSKHTERGEEEKIYLSK